MLLPSLELSSKVPVSILGCHKLCTPPCALHVTTVAEPARKYICQAVLSFLPAMAVPVAEELKGNDYMMQAHGML